MKEQGGGRIEARLDAALRALTHVETDRIARSTQRTLRALRDADAPPHVRARIGWAWRLAGAGVLPVGALAVLLLVVMRPAPGGMPAPLASRALNAVATVPHAPVSAAGLLEAATPVTPTRESPNPRPPARARREDPLVRLTAAVRQLPEEVWERPANPFPPLQEMVIEEMTLVPLHTAPLPDMASGFVSDDSSGGSE